MKLSNKPLVKKESLVSLPWLSLLWLQNLSGFKKIKVGFGPVLEDQKEGGVRAYRIDPIVKFINRFSERYVCDVFFSYNEISKFDICVIVRGEYWNFGNDLPELTDRIIELQKSGKKFIYDIVDSKWFFDAITSNSKIEETEKAINFIKAVDAVILSSPLQRQDLNCLNARMRMIEHPALINKSTKRNATEKEIKIIWQGYAHNSGCAAVLHPVVKRIKAETGLPLTFLYHTNSFENRDETIKFKKWNRQNSQREMIDSDIAVSIKPLSDPYQQRKPSTKIIQFMAAGLPCICTPSEADIQVIEDGKTGYFAFTGEDWYRHLKTLVQDPELRKKIGSAGRKSVLEKFSLKAIVQKYLNLFDELSP